jgi:hypothetical protein
VKNWRSGLADTQGRAMTAQPIPHFKTVRVGGKAGGILPAPSAIFPPHSAEGAIKPLFRPTCWEHGQRFEPMERILGADQDD